MGLVEKMGHRLKIYFPVWSGSMIFSVMVYSLLMSAQLVNQHDGIWHYSTSFAGRWEMSLGRWFWPYLDRMRFHLSCDPITSILTLACFMTGIMLLLDLYNVGNSKIAYLFSGLFMSSTVVCVSLSYRYMSLTFGMAFLLGILAVWVIVEIQKPVIAIPLGALMISLSMGLYQAYLGCTCVTLLGYFLDQLEKEVITLKTIVKMIVKGIITILLGGVLYYAILQLHLKALGIKLSAYNGANTYSLLNTIQKMPTTVVKIYREFYRYFFDDSIRTNVLQNKKIYLFVFIFILILLVVKIVKIRRQNIRKCIMFIGLVMLTPLACNVVLLLATDSSVSVQMTAPLALSLSVMLYIAGKGEYHYKTLKYLRCFVMVFMSFVLYGCIYQTLFDQTAMQEGQTATVSLSEEIIHRLDDGNYLNSEMQYCFIGRPADNEFFNTPASFSKANSYAAFGDWNISPSCTVQSWSGVFHYLCGIDIQICSSQLYSEIISDEEVKGMPTFPQEGSILIKNDIVIVKVADVN